MVLVTSSRTPTEAARVEETRKKLKEDLTAFAVETDLHTPKSHSFASYSSVKRIF